MHKAILVGRDAPDGIPYNIVETLAVTFSTEVEECMAQVEALFDKAEAADAILLFQNTPGIVAAAVCRIYQRNPPTHLKGVGVVISKPGERPAGLVANMDRGVFHANMTREQIDVVLLDFSKQINPNAKMEDGQIVCDPPMKFEFDKVEWFA